MVNELFRFAEQKNLLFDGSRPFAIYHDNPEFTLDQHLNTSVCLSINKEIKVNEKIGYMTIPSAKYAIAHFRLKPNQYREAWDYFYGDYLPRSGYQPDNAHVFEMYMSNPNDSVNRIHNTDIYLPVRSI